jgi:hypothetical protein
MARLLVDGDTLMVRLSLLERLGALRGDVRVPLRAVRGIRVSDRPWEELRGVRAAGTGLPRVIALGTRGRRGTREFAAVYRCMPGVVVELDGAALARLVVSTADPSEVARRVADARGRVRV